MRPWTLALLLLLLSHVASEKAGGFVFVKGAFGAINETTSEGLLPTNSLAKILQKSLRATGREDFRPAQHDNRVVKDKRGHQHVRFEQSYQGIPVVDTAMVLHLDENGIVYAMNGEYVVDGSVDRTERVSCEEAFNNTLETYGGDAVWLSECAKMVVLDLTGRAHLAWQRMVGFTPDGNGPYQNNYLYASVVSGEIVAERPQIVGLMQLSTYTCHNALTTTNCTLISNSSQDIHSGDRAADSAHLYTRATWDWFKTNMNRDSIDNRGKRLVSYVHYGDKYNNAFWNGKSMVYGDGDGKRDIVNRRCSVGRHND